MVASRVSHGENRERVRQKCFKRGKKAPPSAVLAGVLCFQITFSGFISFMARSPKRARCLKEKWFGARPSSEQTRARRARTAAAASATLSHFRFFSAAGKEEPESILPSYLSGKRWLHPHPHAHASVVVVVVGVRAGWLRRRRRPGIRWDFVRQRGEDGDEDDEEEEEEDAGKRKGQRAAGVADVGAFGSCNDSRTHSESCVGHALKKSIQSGLTFRPSAFPMESMQFSRRLSFGSRIWQLPVVLLLSQLILAGDHLARR